ncbi:MAG: hypothetical protein CM15mP74_18810 [Halieaceae bacterium]|nr:MAG: hypothetical protein CM15mP74_18810 [Halieaceae bacterium]
MSMILLRRRVPQTLPVSRHGMTFRRPTISSRHSSGLHTRARHNHSALRRIGRDNADVSADLTWDVYDSGASFGQLRTGFQLIYRERDSESSTYGFNVNQVRDDLLRTSNLLVSDVVFTCDGESSRGGVRSRRRGRHLQ